MVIGLQMANVFTHKYFKKNKTLSSRSVGRMPCIAFTYSTYPQSPGRRGSWTGGRASKRELVWAACRWRGGPLVVQHRVGGQVGRYLGSAQLAQWGRPGASRLLATTCDLGELNPFPVRPSACSLPATHFSKLASPCSIQLDTCHLLPGWRGFRPGASRSENPGLRLISDHKTSRTTTTSLSPLHFAAPSPDRGFT